MPSSSRIDHAAKLTDLPDKEMIDLLPIAKKCAEATVSLFSSAAFAPRISRVFAGSGKLQPAPKQRPSRSSGRRSRPLSHHPEGLGIIRFRSRNRLADSGILKGGHSKDLGGDEGEDWRIVVTRPAARRGARAIARGLEAGDG